MLSQLADTFIELHKYPFDRLGSLNIPGDLYIGLFARESLTDFAHAEMRTMGLFSSLEDAVKADDGVGWDEWKDAISLLPVTGSRDYLDVLFSCRFIAQMSLPSACLCSSRFGEQTLPNSPVIKRASNPETIVRAGTAR